MVHAFVFDFYSMTQQPNPQEQGFHALKLSFAGSKGVILVKNLNKTLENVLSSNIKKRST